MDWRRRLLLAATGLAWSCQASESLVDAPVLSQVRQVVLQDSLAGLAWPTALATDPDGGFYVLEIRFGMVHRFHSDGGFLRHYGVPGDGPGELRLPVAAGTVADTILAVADLAHQGVELFDRRTGGSLGRLPVPERPSSIAAAGGDLWVGAIAEAKGTALFRGTAPSGPLTAVGRLPVEYQAGGVVAGNYSRVIAVPGTDGTVLVGFEASDSLDLMDAAGRWTRLHLPRRTRRGLLAEANTVLRTKRFDEIMVAQSSLTALARMSDGSIAAVHLDQRLTAPPPIRPGPNGRLPVTADLYISVISADRRRACADARLKPLGGLIPQVAFRGDTLLVLDQDSIGSTVSTTITAYVIDTTHCRWMAT